MPQFQHRVEAVAGVADLVDFVCHEEADFLTEEGVLDFVRADGRFGGEAVLGVLENGLYGRWMSADPNEE